VRATGLCIIVAILATGSVAAAAPIEWHAWGVHGATIDDSSFPTSVTAVTGVDANYHWNKSNWDTRIGQKAFLSTSHFNGMLVGTITGLDWDVIEGYWGNAYFNVMVEDANGKKAILAPSLNSATSTGWEASGNAFSVFEAEAGWTGTAATGWYAATWDEVKDLVITDGPFTEFPDTLTGAATAQNDSVYTAANWAAWSGGNSSDGFLITFGQSTGTSTPVTTIGNISIEYETIPEPGTLILFGAGLFGGLMIVRRRRTS